MSETLFESLFKTLKGMSLVTLTNGSESTLDRVEYGLLLTNAKDIDTKAGMFNTIHPLFSEATEKDVFESVDDGAEVWGHIELLRSKGFRLQNEHCVSSDDFAAYLRALGFEAEVLYPEEVAL